MKCKLSIYALMAFIAVINAVGCSGAGTPGAERSDSAYKIPIALEGSLQNPAWSPDGSAIVLTRFRNGYNQGPADLVIYDLESGDTRVLVSDGYENVNLPGSAWNLATDQIAFSSSREPHDEIFVISADADPGEEIKVTGRDQLVAYEPSFSPDGDWIVFESHKIDVEGNGVITSYRMDGSGTYQALTDINGDCRQPNWSPDGRHIVYQSLHDGRWELWMMGFDGTDQRQVTGGRGDKTDASFSPDGQWIVYSADGPEIEYGNLFMSTISGGEPLRVTESSGYDGAPSWSPDGRQIVFESSGGAPEDTPGTTLWMIDVSE